MYPFPLRVHSSGRYLIDSTGLPFLMQGEAAWSLTSQINDTDTLQYLDDRVSRGFNAIITECMEHKFTDATPAWKNAAGDIPFDSSNNFDQPNEPFWVHLDWLLKRCEERGIVVLLTPAYLGFTATDEGWYDVMVTNGTTKLRTYGQFLGNRYKRQDNIIWMHGADRQPADPTLTEAVANGILDNDTSKVHTAHVVRGTSAWTYWGPGNLNESWLKVNTSYTGDVVDQYTAHLAEYGRSPTMPFVNIEAIYEKENSVTDLTLRNQIWWTYLSGGVGHFFGNNPIWGFGDSPSLAFQSGTPSSDWKAVLGGNGSVFMNHAGRVLKPRRWYDLVPDQTHVYVTGGNGTSGTSDYATVSAAANGELLIGYFPTSRTVTLDATKFSKPFYIRWIDPANGAVTNVTPAGNPHNVFGSFSLAGNGTNSAGDSDWVLVCEAARDVVIGPWPITKTINAVRR